MNSRASIARTLLFPAALAALLALPAYAAEELVTTARLADGETVPYILNTGGASPRYVVILFPGGTGIVNPRMENGVLVYGFAGNFLVRSRSLIADGEFATVTTNTTQSEERVQALIDDIRRRFADARIYLMGTSNGTGATMALAAYLADRIAGVIHTASLNEIHDFNARGYRNRQLIVHHRADRCRATRLNAAQASHDRFGSELIVMEGGMSTGDLCGPFAHHGFNGIERETIDAIKKWIKAAG